MSAGDNITLNGINTIASNKMPLITSSTDLSCSSLTANTDMKLQSSFNLGQTDGNILKFSIDQANLLTIIQANDSYNLSINPQGNYVGVGVVPSYRLDVCDTNINKSVTFSYIYIFADANYVQNYAYNTYNVQFSAKIEGDLWGKSWIAMNSDERIKTNIQDIDDDSALQLILKIQPKTYQYIDKIEKGDRKVYGFIAQQIRDVIPEAVTIQPEIIPNIYKIGFLSNSNVITMDTDISNIIKIDSDITLITSNIGKKEYKVTDVNSNQFKIDTDINDSNNVFVYGTKVNDFHVLDKNYIYTLNVCATQELYKMINEQNQQISELEQNCELLSNIINEQQIIIDNLKTL